MNSQTPNLSGSGATTSPVATPFKVPLLHGFPMRRKVVPHDIWKQYPKRRHGFHRPWHLLQIASWVLFISFLVVVCLYIAPFLPSPFNIVVYCYYGVSYAIMITSNVMATLIDPADPGTKINPSTDNMYACHHIASVKCTICNAWIRNESKHCKACNKCVSDFDHHCKWLNTCVGSANYKYFFIFLSTTLLMSTGIIVMCCWVLRDLADDEHKWKGLLKDDLNSTPIENYRAGICVTLALDVIAFGLLVHLFSFHVILCKRMLTTYEWIVIGRKGIVMKTALATQIANQKKETCNSHDGLEIEMGFASDCTEDASDGENSKESAEDTSTPSPVPQPAGGKSSSFTPPVAASTSNGSPNEGTQTEARKRRLPPLGENSL
eukprot:TRINITY_DN13039_c0_g1_i1.p1 TRINITY_DN13039_c0_g1~~TRINITY_DN13039_c0_g1_i1.p1  ORF type:complete len:378 (+),score=43.91 TRINITY_DN13039_c0_g1_i1:64-1197(+)